MEVSSRSQHITGADSNRIYRSGSGNKASHGCLGSNPPEPLENSPQEVHELLVHGQAGIDGDGQKARIQAAEHRR